MAIERERKSSWALLFSLSLDFLPFRSPIRKGSGGGEREEKNVGESENEI